MISIIFVDITCHHIRHFVQRLDTPHRVTSQPRAARHPTALCTRECFCPSREDPARRINTPLPSRHVQQGLPRAWHTCACMYAHMHVRVGPGTRTVQRTHKRALLHTSKQTTSQPGADAAGRHKLLPCIAQIRAPPRAGLWPSRVPCGARQRRLLRARKYLVAPHTASSLGRRCFLRRPPRRAVAVIPLCGPSVPMVPRPVSRRALSLRLPVLVDRRAHVLHEPHLRVDVPNRNANVDVRTRRAGKGTEDEARYGGEMEGLCGKNAHVQAGHLCSIYIYI